MRHRLFAWRATLWSIDQKRSSFSLLWTHKVSLFVLFSHVSFSLFSRHRYVFLSRFQTRGLFVRSVSIRYESRHSSILRLRLSIYILQHVFSHSITSILVDITHTNICFLLMLMPWHNTSQRFRISSTNCTLVLTHSSLSQNRERYEINNCRIQNSSRFLQSLLK